MYIVYQGEQRNAITLDRSLGGWIDFLLTFLRFLLPCNFQDNLRFSTNKSVKFSYIRFLTYLSTDNVTNIEESIEEIFKIISVEPMLKMVCHRLEYYTRVDGVVGVSL